MNEWEMLHSKHGKGFPLDESNGKRKREIEAEGKKERRRRDGKERGPQSFLRLQRKGETG